MISETSCLEKRLKIINQQVKDYNNWAEGKKKLTIDEAVDTLNTFKHNDYVGWKYEEYPKHVRGIGYDLISTSYSEFEAIAIAEKYEREDDL